MTSLKVFFQSLGDYFISQSIPADSRFVIAGMILSGVLLLIGLLLPFIASRIKSKKFIPFRSLVTPLSSLFRIMGFLWLLLFFLRYEGIPLFMVRLWVYSLLIPFGIMIVLIIRRHKKVLPSLVKEDVLKERYQKYLPKSRA
jgi:hypothetical protein